MDGGVTITGYEGHETDLSIPESLDGSLITRIGADAFTGGALTFVNIPPSVQHIDPRVFQDNGLTSLALGGPATHRPAEFHGALRVEGSRIVDTEGREVQLRGTSLFHSNSGGRFYPPETVD